MNLEYFNFKNGFIEFVFPHREKLLNPYGMHIEEGEKRQFHKNNFDEIIQSKENVVSQDLDKTIIKTDSFYLDFLNYLSSEPTAFNVADIKCRIRPITYDFEQVKTNQLILLSHLNVNEKVVLLNSSNPFGEKEL